ncbi:MAG: tRNA pseudouridine(38-40) synthase TruA [Ignavibacteriaceae bacterium]
MNNYKLIIQYDGTDYSGWQIQSGSKTIQQILSDSIETISKEKVNLIGSGRTDAGVHAFGQSANFRIEQDLDIYRFKHSLNSVLPSDISVLVMEKTDEDFHARFDARKRTYIYIITKFKSPFFKRYSYQFPGTLDLSELNRISSSFIGNKDYSSFCKKNAEIENKFCEVFDAKWYEKDDLIIFEISANRFLHGMVRTITGTILKAIESKGSEDMIEKIFNERNREAASMAVPAQGLFLFKVDY